MSCLNLGHSICSRLVAITPYSLDAYDVMMLQIQLAFIMSHSIIHLCLVDLVFSQTVPLCVQWQMRPGTKTFMMSQTP